MTATDERQGLDVGGLLAQLAELTHERDELRAALLVASDAADLAQAERADWYRAGWLAGADHGAEVGNARADPAEARAAESYDVGWRSIGDLGDGYAELDRLRYPPSGRVSWLIRNLGGTWAAWTEYDKQEGGA